MDDIGGLAGEYLWSLAIVGGSAWKMEGALARFLREKYVPPDAYGSVQVLLRGLSHDDLQPPACAVQSVDWYWPTSGELGSSRAQTSLGDRRAKLAAERRTAETACRKALVADISA